MHGATIKIKNWSTICAEVDVVCCESLSCFGTYKNLPFFIYIYIYIYSNCGFHFCCEPTLCVERVMDHSLLHGMMLGLWHSCLSCSRPLYLLCPTVLVESLLTRTFFLYSVLLCSVFSLHLLILVLFAYVHCRSKRELTYCVKCSLWNVVVVFKL